MKTKFLRSMLAGFLLFGCGIAYSLTPTKIQDVLEHPRDFEGKDITLSGTVTNAVSLVLVKYYEIQDGTGTIKVITDKLLPSRGEKLSVTGRMMVVELGTERWVVIRENQSFPDQNIGSGKQDYFSQANNY